MRIQPEEIKAGDRIRVTEIYRDGERITEGVVSTTTYQDALFVGGVPSAFVASTPTRSVVIERLAPPLPRGMGAVIRAKVYGSGPMTLIRTESSPTPWLIANSGTRVADSELTEIQIVSEGVVE